MFTNTAYEALYQYIGLALQSRFIELITSEAFFKAIVLMIFGILFFMTSVKFLSRYMPGNIIARKNVPLASFVKIIACLFLGISLLKVGASTSVKSYSGKSWDTNPYVKSRYKDVQRTVKVSFVFDILSRTAEESAALLNRIVDRAMGKSHSQLQTPNFFYKAVMYSGSATIESNKLKNIIHFYTEECFDKALPRSQNNRSPANLSEFFKTNGNFDQALSQIDVKTRSTHSSTCLDVKDQVQLALREHANSYQNSFWRASNRKHPRLMHDDNSWVNMAMANMLVNHYLDEDEAGIGIMKGSQVGGMTSRVFQYLGRFFSIDGLLSLTGLSDSHGSTETAVRSRKFSEHLARAPHVAGILKMVLIFIFPFLMFFVVAGKWKVLIYWFAIYGSVLLWAPLWTLFYHIMINLTQSIQMMEAVGRLSDGVSLYSAKVVSSRIYYFYSIYSWIQILVATFTTGGMFLFLRPMLTENESEKAPEFLGDAGSAARTASSVTSII